MDRQIIQRNTSELSHVSQQNTVFIDLMFARAIRVVLNSLVALIFTPIANVLLYG